MSHEDQSGAVAWRSHSPPSPQTDGVVVYFNHTLKSILNTFVSGADTKFHCARENETEQTFQYCVQGLCKCTKLMHMPKKKN